MKVSVPPVIKLTTCHWLLLPHKTHTAPSFDVPIQKTNTCYPPKPFKTPLRNEIFLLWVNKTCFFLSIKISRSVQHFLQSNTKIWWKSNSKVTNSLCFLQLVTVCSVAVRWQHYFYIKWMCGQFGKKKIFFLSYIL